MENIAIIAYETSTAVCSSMMMHVDMISEAGYHVLLFTQKVINDYNVFEACPYKRVVFDKFDELPDLFNEYHIHKVWCTNTMAVLKILRLAELPVFLWKQGDTAAESFMTHHNYLRKWILQLIDAFTLRRVTGIVYVSDAMKSYYENKYKIKTKSIVVPCLSEFAGYKSNTARVPNSFVYIGGLSVWQCFDEILQIYSKLRSNNSVFHIITLDVETARKKVMQYIGDENNIKIYSITNRNLIPEILSGFQYGFLIRKNDVVNMVAAPIKFLEYLSCGVNVIMTDAVASYAKIVKEKKVGTIIKMDAEDVVLNEYNPLASQVYNDLFNRHCFINDYNFLLTSNIK